MGTFRTVLEQKISERRETLAEFAEYANVFAREHREKGTLSVRHLQRLVSGVGPNGRPLGRPQAPTVRLLESIFGLGIDELLAKPDDTISSGSVGVAEVPSRHKQPAEPRRGHSRAAVSSPPTGSGLATSFVWLDERAGWIPDTSRRRVMSRLAKLDMGDLVDRHLRRARVTRSQTAKALAEYYRATDELYRVRCGGRDLVTSVVTRPDWLDLSCPLTPGNDRLVLVNDVPDAELPHDDLGPRQAVNRLAEVAALDVRVRDAPIYRLLDVDLGPAGISGSVTRVPFVEYALTMDLLEAELVDAVANRAPTRPGDLPLRDRYLPDLDSVFGLSGRLCAGGPLALCAIARPSDPYRGGADFALLVQERSGHVVNAARRLAVIPKGFHQPLKDPRAEAGIGSTLRREMEEELFGRHEVDNTADENRVAEPMHPGRLSDPMRWLTQEPGRLRAECTGFGFNLVSGNYEFASLIVIEDEEFWTRYGGEVEANWEAAGLRLYSSRDPELVEELVSDESWTNEGLFALLQGLRRLAELGDDRVDLPEITHRSVTTATAR